MVRLNPFKRPPNRPCTRHLQIHSLLDTDLSPPVQFHRWHICLFQLSFSTPEERAGFGRPRIPTRTCTIPLAFALSRPVLLPTTFPLAHTHTLQLATATATASPGRRRMAKTTPAQRPSIPMDLCAPRPLFLSHRQPLKRCRRCCRARVCPHGGVQRGGVLHVNVRLWCLVLAMRC